MIFALTVKILNQLVWVQKYKQKNLPKKILVDKKSITETESIAESFNE